MAMHLVKQKLVKQGIQHLYQLTVSIIFLKEKVKMENLALVEMEDHHHQVAEEDTSVEVEPSDHV